MSEKGFGGTYEVEPFTTLKEWLHQVVWRRRHQDLGLFRSLAKAHFKLIIKYKLRQ